MIFLQLYIQTHINQVTKSITCLSKAINSYIFSLLWSHECNCCMSICTRNTMICIYTEEDLKVHTQVGNDWTSSALCTLANLPLLNKDLPYVGAARNHGGHTNWSYTRTINHVAWLEHCATFHKMG